MKDKHCMTPHTHEGPRLVGEEVEWWQREAAGTRCHCVMGMVRRSWVGQGLPGHRNVLSVLKDTLKTAEVVNLMLVYIFWRNNNFKQGLGLWLSDGVPA